MTTLPLVQTSRGIGDDHHIENIHYGAIAVVNAQGKLLQSVGDPNWLTFSRSTIKPFQATPFITDGGMADIKLTLQEVALLCSSHNGENFHSASALSILAKAQASESDLQCGCHTPLLYSTKGQIAPPNSQWTQVQNNCSGKHSGFIAWCKLHSKPTANYLDMGHPLQKVIRKSLSIWCDESEDNFKAGIDGCSAPNYALPLQKLAIGYARLASTRSGGSAKTLFDAMTTHPEYVSGTGRHDLAFMKAGAGDWVAKIGADGVQLIGIRSAGIGIAVKVSDGNQRAVICAAIEVLRQLDFLKDIEHSPLSAWAKPSIKNARGLITGQVTATFKLETT